MSLKSVYDVEGHWIEPELDSSLIERCRDNWTKPVSQLSNYVLATFIRQNFALSLVIPEATRRIQLGYIDGSELYDEELAAAVNGLTGT